MAEFIRVEGLAKKYNSNYIIKDLSLNIPRGRIIGLLGENGVGKTTLLRLLGDLLYKDSGIITLDQQPMASNLSKIAYLLEPTNLYEWMKIKDAITYYKDFFDDFDKQKAMQLCYEFNLEPDQKISKLSKGNKERVCLLLMLARQACLYLMDEPMGGLDPSFKKQMKKIILSNIQKEATVIIATHLIKDLESLFDQVIIMKENEIIHVGADEIRERHNKSIEDFYLEVVGND